MAVFYKLKRDALAEANRLNTARGERPGSWQVVPNLDRGRAIRPWKIRFAEQPGPGPGQEITPGAAPKPKG